MVNTVEVPTTVNIIQLNEFGRKEQPADYETAIGATGFGLFNVLLVLAALPIAWASAFDMSTSAFILASSECEFELTFFRKGILNSMIFIGMMMSIFFWNFFMERMNRKPLLLVALLIDVLCNISCSITESYHLLLLFKFITGTIVGGPFTLLVPYINEFQPANYRAKFSTWSGLVFGIGFIIPAVLAFIVTPLTWSIEVFDRVYPSWRIYLMLCTIPSIIGLLTMSLLPESPKRLMEDGHLSRAHDLLRRIYLINNWKSSSTYSIKELQSPVKFAEVDMKIGQKITQSWENIKTLFQKPYLSRFLIINFLQFGSMLAFNTMRLWVPTMYQIISNFDKSSWDWSQGFPSTCDYMAIAIIPTNETIHPSPSCIRWKINAPVYVNSTIIAASAIGLSFLFSLYYTTRRRKRNIMIFCYVMGLLGAYGTNWGQYVPWMLAQAAVVVVTGRTTANIVMSVNTSVIPLPLRVTAVTFVMNIGNLASIVGNLIFSWLLEVNCIVGFMGIGIILSVCLVMSLFILEPEKVEKSDGKSSTS